MSIVAQGSATLAWVCRCSSGLRSASSPAIHILAGENVCIQAITPMQPSSRVGLEHHRRMAPESVSTGFHDDSARRRRPAASSCSAICLRLGGHLVERLRAVEVLAAGEEPDLAASGVAGHADRARSARSAQRWP